MDTTVSTEQISDEPSTLGIETSRDVPNSSENDRIIKALETGFSNLLTNQKEFAKKQDERAERLQQAVEALKQKVSTPEKKTAFWQAYKNLADEHDEEFQRKYSTDLDTALIFVSFQLWIPRLSFRSSQESNIMAQIFGF
ncbi:hypothetical protein MVEN_01212100 [Mycena venus]|uniref:Uncharacterized protein n=1 Tax=Mycena venus TaxID=2733690 RepID=A0A8H6Y4E5_9AGAR|nr:hypothetical protein MVEN_01212100 [Mycena venus]